MIKEISILIIRKIIRRLLAVIAVVFREFIATTLVAPAIEPTSVAVAESPILENPSHVKIRLDLRRSLPSSYVCGL
jgi:hypothetical protein